MATPEHTYVPSSNSAPLSHPTAASLVHTPEPQSRSQSPATPPEDVRPSQTATASEAARLREGFTASSNPGRRQFLALAGSSAVGLALPATANTLPPTPAPPTWPAPDDTAGLLALINCGLELQQAEEMREGDTDPNGDSETEVFTVNGLYSALEEAPRYRKAFSGFLQMSDTIRGRSEYDSICLADAARALSAEMFRAGQLSAAAKFNQSAAEVR